LGDNKQQTIPIMIHYYSKIRAFAVLGTARLVIHGYNTCESEGENVALLPYMYSSNYEEKNAVDARLNGFIFFHKRSVRTRNEGLMAGHKVLRAH
jgi:hypothetical protein